MKQCYYFTVDKLLHLTPLQFLHTIEHLVPAFLQLHLLSLHLSRITYQSQLIISDNLSGISCFFENIGFRIPLIKVHPNRQASRNYPSIVEGCDMLVMHVVLQQRKLEGVFFN